MIQRRNGVLLLFRLQSAWLIPTTMGYSGAGVTIGLADGRRS